LRKKIFTDADSHDTEYLLFEIIKLHLVDMVVVFPATANIISKCACGICDNIASNAILSSNCPVVFLPSMNSNMWFNQITQRNVEIIKSIGYYVIDPVDGYEVATMSIEPGAMPSYEVIFEKLKLIHSMHGVRLI
jgi:phosphopantothenoylcysteine decarboxylase/phosphopantothenate--cysteine ligase